MEHFTTLPAMDSGGMNRYPLQLLEVLIMSTLNPVKNDLTQIDEELTATLSAELESEEARLQLLINSQIFALGKKNEIELLIKLYHSSLVILLDQCLKAQKKLPSKNNKVKDLYKGVLNSIEGLLTYIEERFSEYLGMESRAPATFLIVSQKELRNRIDKLKVKLKKHNIPCPSADIVLDSLEQFLGIAAGDNVSFRNVVYYKELVQELEKLNCQLDRGHALSKIDEVLIYMNFNSKRFIKHLINTFMQKIDKSEKLTDKMDTLRFYKKSFSQIHRRQGIIFNPDYSDLQKIVGNWFTEEIKYLEEKNHLPLLSLGEGTEKNITVEQEELTPVSKVRLDLSSDQMGLILRGADEARILVSRSLNTVFKTIVPHLASPNKENLSFNGMRAQSYVAEERDKEIAIGALEKIIRKIREY